MQKPQGNFPLGKSEKINVAAQRLTVNTKEAENVGEQAAAAADKAAPPVTFSKHGTFPGGTSHTVMDLFPKDKAGPEGA